PHFDETRRDCRHLGPHGGQGPVLHARTLLHGGEGGGTAIRRARSEKAGHSAPPFVRTNCERLCPAAKGDRASSSGQRDSAASEEQHDSVATTRDTAGADTRHPGRRGRGGSAASRTLR